MVEHNFWMDDQEIHQRCKADAPSWPHGDPRNLGHPKHRPAGSINNLTPSSSVWQGGGTMAPSNCGPRWQTPQDLPEAGGNGKCSQVETENNGLAHPGVVRVCQSGAREKQTPQWVGLWEPVCPLHAKSKAVVQDRLECKIWEARSTHYVRWLTKCKLVSNDRFLF